MGYCKRCHRAATALDERLNADDRGIRPGLQRVICRTALELSYEPTVALLIVKYAFVAKTAHTFYSHPLASPLDEST